VQEALTNALKHSGAAPTDITVRYAQDGVGLDIIDAGTSRQRESTAGQGLAGMRERVAHHGGRLRAEPAPSRSRRTRASLRSAAGPARRHERSPRGS
jgi:signal transduction histidine kinase